MAIEILLIVLVVTVFGGMLLGLFLSYREIEARRTDSASTAATTKGSRFYGGRERDAVRAQELALRQIEHHLRREELLAEYFIAHPSPQTLRAGRESRLAGR
jgi:hypothetical protein